MSTGAPQFQPSDNPASFSETWITRVGIYTRSHKCLKFLLCGIYRSRSAQPMIHSCKTMHNFATTVYEHTLYICLNYNEYNTIAILIL